MSRRLWRPPLSWSIMVFVRSELPSGTVTFLFTDVEGSSALLQRLGSVDYGQMLGEHRRLLREAFSRHGGVEVDTQGDSFFVAFPTAGGALEAAREAAASLASTPIRVRIGVHTGTAHVTDEGYVGMDVHKAARISAAGHGGQVLLSATTAALVGAQQLCDLGLHRLKDFPSAERIYQFGGGTFPPLRSPHETHVPIAATPLIGRQGELAQVRAYLAEDTARLLTLLGPGGVGKSRLALQAAVEVADQFPAGVWWVSLAGVTDPAAVITTAEQALGATEGLVERIRDERLLLCLDNFEHVVEAAEELPGLLAACPNLRLLVTSRELLRVPGEQAYRVQPLDPREGEQLFLDRAHAVDPDFVMSDAARELCARLEQLPLALELAAARTRLMSPDQLLERLGRRLDLLKAGRGVVERQQTLRATIGWSYELLNDGEMGLFAGLGQFRGGWTLEAAEEVCDAEMETLQSLVDKSLVSVASTRFQMLETIREYANERLDEAADRDGHHHRHATYYLSLAERAEPNLTGREQPRWLELLDADYDNLRAALQWFVTTPGEEELGLRLASSLTIFWFIRGYLREGLGWLVRMLDTAEDEPSVAGAGALWGAGLLSSLVGEHQEAHRLLVESLCLARALGDQTRAARSLNVLGLLAFFDNEIERSRSLLEESAQLADEAHDQWCLADALGTLSSIYPLVGEFDRAELAGSRSLAIAREAGDRQGIRMALFGLALTAARRGHLASARSSAEEGLTICRQLGDQWFVSYFLWVLADVATTSGCYEEAYTLAEESLHIAADLEAPLLLVCAHDALAAVDAAQLDPDAAYNHLAKAELVARSNPVPGSYFASVLHRLAELAIVREELKTADRCLEESLSLANNVGDVWAVARVTATQATVEEQRANFQSAEELAVKASVRQLQIGDLLGAVDSLERLASILTHQEDFADAALLLSVVTAHRQRIGAAVPPTQAKALPLIRDTIHGALGDAAYRAISDRGKILSPQDVLAATGRYDAQP